MSPAARRACGLVLGTLLTASLLVAAGALAFVWGGFYDVSATGPHWRPVHRLLEVALRQAVRYRAEAVSVPDGWNDAAHRPLGAACFRDRCVTCHGAPGVAPEAFALALQPVPSSLVEASRHWRPAELYWITRHGIKMSGMPAWEYRLAEEELWAVVAFLDHLPSLKPMDYKRLAAAAPPSCRAPPEAPAPRPAGTRPRSGAAPGAGSSEAAMAPDALTSDRWEAARSALAQHGCIACHMIPGVVGPVTGVGPRLEGLGSRGRIAGHVQTAEDSLARWIRDPQSVDPHTAMPTVGISETQARLMAAYLLAH